MKLYNQKAAQKGGFCSFSESIRGLRKLIHGNPKLSIILLRDE